MTVWLSVQAVIPFYIKPPPHSLRRAGVCGERMFQKLFVAGEVGDAVKALLQVGVGGDAVGHLAVVEQWVRANEKHPETYASRCCFLVGAGGLREPRC